MIKTPTALVLGAGASASYGFPMGSKLRGDILNLTGGLHQLAQGAELHKSHDLAGFVAEFQRSRLYSIDAFLGMRDEFAEIGKLAIAAVLLHYESKSVGALLQSVSQDWYDYLWNRLASGHSWDELSFDNLSIITFNYDRSLEAFLLQAMRGTYGVSEETAVERLRQLKIIHVYGDIGPPLPGDPQYVPYGEPLSGPRVRDAASRLKVIPEARDDDPIFAEAQTLLTGAEAICFLGFGFDELNLRRLKASETCANHLTREGAEPKRRAFFASCVGKKGAEASRDAKLCGQLKSSPTASGFPPHFIHGNCMVTLTESLVLG
jgi:hypothetical protein